MVFDKIEISKNFFVYQVENLLEKAIASAHGTTMRHLTKHVFDSLVFYLPSLEKQDKIATVLDKINELIAKSCRQIEKLDELVKSQFIEMFGEPSTNTKGRKIEKAEKHIDILSGFPFDGS